VVGFCPKLIQILPMGELSACPQEAGFGFAGSSAYRPWRGRAALLALYAALHFLEHYESIIINASAEGACDELEFWAAIIRYFTSSRAPPRVVSASGESPRAQKRQRLSQPTFRPSWRQVIYQQAVSQTRPPLSNRRDIYQEFTALKSHLPIGADQLAPYIASPPAALIVFVRSKTLDRFSSPPKQRQVTHRRIRHGCRYITPESNVSATNDCSIHWANLKDLGIAASGIVEAWGVDECERVRPELAWDFFNINHFCISQSA
jgi:hypothetical protein